MDLRYYHYDDDQSEIELLQNRMIKSYFRDDFGFDNPSMYKPLKEMGMLYVKDTSEERRLKEKLKFVRKQEKEAREREHEARIREHNAIVEAAKQRVDLMVSAKLAQLESVHEKPAVTQPQEEAKIETPPKEEVVIEKEEVVIEKEEIRDESEKFDNEDGNGDECVVCMDAKPTMVFVPCGHFITCSVCCKVETCPKCRGVIQTRVKLFK